VSAIEYGGDAYAFRSALRSATTVRVKDSFDDIVVAGINQAPGMLEQAVAQIRTILLAIMCGAIGMFFMIHVALQAPAVPSFDGDRSLPSQSIDLDQLMRLLDKPGQRIASVVLIEQCTQQQSPSVSAVSRIEPKLQRRASVAVSQILV
jgi:hypothetical protein